MDWANVKDPIAPAAEPSPLVLVETCWRMQSPSGKILQCGIYRTPYGYEARMGYGDPHLIASQYCLTIELAREYAENFRVMVVEHSRFTALS
jgi:hypothetical protein